MPTCTWFHSYTRLKFSGNSPPTIKKKDLVSKAISLGVFLCGATSKRDSMWHSPVFTCIRANRIPVEIYNKFGMIYAVIWMQFLWLNFLFLVIKILLMNIVCHTFKWKSFSQFLFANAIAFLRDKYGQLVKCWAFIISSWQGHILIERVVELLHLGKFEGRVTFQGNFGVIRRNHYAASLDVNSWFRIWETKRDGEGTSKINRNDSSHICR